MLRQFLTAASLMAAAPGLPFAKEAKLPAPEISEAMPFEVKSVEVLDSTMAYIESGSGAPILFLHGNPTSSYLWRNVIPHVAGQGRAVAVDLIGMGASGKPAIAYRFADHARYLEAFIDRMGFETVTLVGHDWGAALAWHYASRHPERIEGIAFMEAVLPPSFPLPGYEVMGEAGAALKALRDPVKGEELVFGQNMFVEAMLPGFVNRTLGEAAMTQYRRPYLEPKDRLPTLQWPRELPIAGEPAESVAVMEEIAAFMQATELPVLLLYADPGIATPAAAVDWYRAEIAGIETVYVGQGLHFIQEDHPVAIGRALSDWLRRHRSGS